YYFDFAIVDAPCSGEGMFRKSEIAVTEWSEENVRACQTRQSEILENAQDN
ncbi:MAG: RNA methyltransferase, partial [Clostridia bacterium]|nr:RNA methyltransferase [Clostridia bacterium]